MRIENKTDDSNSKKRKESDAEIVDLVPKEARQDSSRTVEDFCRGNIVKSGGGNGVGIVRNTRTDEPANRKTDGNTKKPGKKPERRTF